MMDDMGWDKVTAAELSNTVTCRPIHIKKYLYIVIILSVGQNWRIRGHISKATFNMMCLID